MLINLLIRILDIVVAVLGLLLVLRVVLPWLRVSRAHPLMRFLVTVTEPLVRAVRRLLGNGGVYWTRGGAIDLAPIAAFFVIWLTQAVLTQLLGWVATPPLWLFQPGQNLERWLIRLIGLLVQLYSFLLLVRVLLTWVRIAPRHPLVRFLWAMTEPLLAPIRRRLPPFGGLDFSPIVAVLLLALLQSLLVALIRTLL